MIEKLKNNKKDIIEFLIILIIAIVMCNGFIRMHYTTDTYKIADEGYKNYAINWSLKDGRLVMFGMLMLSDLLRVPINIINYVFTIIGMIFSCLSVIWIKNIIMKIKKCSKIQDEIIILIICYMIIFNFMYIEAIYFLEIIIISLSLLLFVLSAKILLDEKKNYFIKSIALAILGIIAYQGTISFFIAFSIFLLIVKNEKVNKNVLRKFFEIAFISLVAVISSILIVKIIGNLISVSQNRISLENIYSNIIYIFVNFKSILIASCGLIPKYTYISIIGIIFIFSMLYIKLYDKNFINNIVRILLIVFFGISSCFLIFIATSSSFDCGRMYIVLGAIPSFILLYLYCNTNIITNGKEFKKIYYLISILLIIFTTYIFVIRINEARLVNQLENEYCQNIEKYILDNNIKINRACIIPVEVNFDKIYFNDVNVRNKMTINEIRGYESAISGFNVNSNLNLKEINLAENIDVYNKYINELKEGNFGINDSFVMVIDDILIMPAFIW